MLKHLFSCPIWKVSPNIPIDVKEKLLDQILQNFDKNKNYTHPYWGCKVYSTYSDHNNVDYSELVPYLKKEYEVFADEIELKVHDYKIDSIWHNLYQKGSNQECHDHIGPENFSLYSGIYFLKVNRNHPNLVFHNPSLSYTYANAYEKSQEIYSYNNPKHSSMFNKFLLKPSENDFLIFPSYLSHSVEIQKIDDIRITISLNFVLNQ